MSGGGSSPSNVTQTSVTEPPEYVKPYSIEMMERSGALSDAPFQSYDGQRIADFTDQQVMGLEAIQDRAISGNPLTNASQSSGINTLQGDYFGPGMGSSVQAGSNPLLGMDNPYLNQAIQTASDSVMKNYTDVTNPQLAQMQRTAGAFGNTGMQQMKTNALSDLTRNLGDINTGMRMQDYGLQAQLGESDVNRRLGADQFNVGMQQNAWDAERANQMRTMSLAPQYGAMDYTDASKLLGVGDVLRDYNQQGLNLNEQDWMAQQQWPYQQLDVLANGIRTSMGGGGSTVTSSPNAYQPNTTASMLGGGLLGYGVGSELGYPALGAAGGSLMGLWG